MKIVQIVPHYIPASYFGGTQKVAHAIGRSLVKFGHDVTVCTTNLADNSQNLNIPIDTAIDIEGVKVYYEPTYLLRYWGFSPQLAYRIDKEIACADIVFIHHQYQFANLIGPWLAQKAMRPYIMFAHGSLHINSVNSKSALAKKLYLRFLAQNNLYKSLFIAFNAPEELDSSLYKKRGKIIPSGIDPNEFDTMPNYGLFRSRYPELQSKVCLLFLGRIDVAQKGLDLLIPAFAKLYQDNRDIHLVLAGPNTGNGFQQINDLIIKLGIKQAVTFTGMLTGDDKLSALRDVDLFVLPSRYEGLSIALLEAMYSGLPVLITDRVGLCNEIESNYAGIKVSCNVESIYSGLLQLTHVDLRDKMRGRGKDLILRKYTWDAITLNLVDMITKITHREVTT